MRRQSERLCGPAAVRILQAMVLAAALSFASAARAADTLPAERVDGPQAQFDLRVSVDGTTDFYLRGSQIRYEVVKAATPRDAGSTFSEKLPSEPVTLDIQKLEGRGRMEVLERPSDENKWTLRLRIADDEAGSSFYHVRVSWSGEGARLSGASPNRDPSRAFVNEVSVRAEGRGSLEARSGLEASLSQVEVSLTPAGAAILSFTGERRAQFRGTWTQTSAESIQINLGEALGSDAAIGQGELLLDGGRIERIELSGDDRAQASAFTLRFNVEGDYHDFTSPETGTTRSPETGTTSSGSSALELSASDAGRGLAEVGQRPADDLQRATVELRRDGSARLRFEGDRTYEYSGRWTSRPDGADVVLTANGRAIGKGRVTTTAQDQLAAVRLEGRTLEGEGFELQFDSSSQAGGGFDPSESQRAAGRRDELDRGARVLRGEGSLRSERGADAELKAVELRLEPGGAAQLLFSGDESVTLSGSWGRTDDDTLWIAVDQFNRQSASGRGEVELGKPFSSSDFNVESIEVEGLSGNSGRFKLSFNSEGGP